MRLSRVVGLYGISRVGKSSLLHELGLRHPEWRATEGSDAIKAVMGVGRRARVERVAAPHALLLEADRRLQRQEQSRGGASRSIAYSLPSSEIASTVEIIVAGPAQDIATPSSSENASTRCAGTTITSAAE